VTGTALKPLSERSLATSLTPVSSSTTRRDEPTGRGSPSLGEAFAGQAVEIVHPDWIEGDLTRESGYTRAVALLGDSKTAPPDALVCANDMIALGAIDALYEVGLRVPGDVAVVGYDDMSFASSRLIGLTLVGVPRTEMGRVAVRVLLQRMHDPAALPQKIVLPHSLVVRQTCGAAPAVPAGRRRRAGS